MPERSTDVDASSPVSDAPGSHDGLADRSRATLEVLLCAALALGPFLWRVASGTRGLANDDTWAYQRMFATFVDSGSIDLIDWNDINLVGMFPLTRLWVALVGHGPEQLHVLGSVMAFVGLIALRSVARAIAPASTVPVLVGYGLYGGFVFTAGTFMADQFALAGVLVALAVSVRLVTRDDPQLQRVVLLIVVVVASGFAFSVRQQTVVAVGICVLVLMFGPMRRRTDWLVVTVGFGLFAAPFHLWRWSLDDPGSTQFSFDLDELAAGLVLMAAGLSLSIAPVLVHRDGVGVLSRWPIVRLLGSVAVGAAFVVTEPTGVAYDFMRRAGAGHPVIRVLAAVVCWNAVVTVAAGAWGRRLPKRNRTVLVMVAVAAISLAADVAVAALSSAYLPRYSMFTLALVLVALASTETPPAVERALAAGSDAARAGHQVAWALFALVGIWVYWALDEEQVHLRIVRDIAEVTACAGIPDAELDGGIVWVGEHTDEPAHATFWEIEPSDDGLPWTQQQQLFAGQARRAVVVLDAPELNEGTVAFGPFEQGGLLPGSDKQRWLVVRDVDADAIDACGDAPRLVASAA
jgi:hypothetical protein